MAKKTVAAIALLIIASLSVAGCTKSTTTAPATPPDSQLAQYIAQYNTTLNSEHLNNVTAWRVTPINATSAKIQDAWTYPSPTNNAVSVTYSENVTLIRFNSPEQATTFVSNQSAGYRLVATSFPNKLSPEANQRAKGNGTSVYAIYDTGSSLGTVAKLIVQTDQFVWIGDYQYFEYLPSP